eukprot:131119_1
MSVYNRDYGRRIYKTVSSLHRDLDGDSESAIPSRGDDISSRIRDEQMMYHVLPSSTMSPKAARITVQKDNGQVQILNIERTKHEPAHASTRAKDESTEFPLLERIPIIAKQTYTASVKDLINRINALQTLSLKLHSGADEALFDKLQKKVVKLSQSGRAHHHALDGMRLEVKYLLNEISTQQNMREELYIKIEGMGE